MGNRKWYATTRQKAFLTVEQQRVNAEGIYDYLHNQAGLTTAATCAILGNMAKESSLNPGSNTTSNSGGTAGLIQWHPATVLTNWVKVTYKSSVWWYPPYQLKRIIYELDGVIPETWDEAEGYPYSGADFKKMTDLALATRVYYENRERSGGWKEIRYTYAKQWYEYFGGNPDTDTSGEDTTPDETDDPTDSVATTRRGMPIWLYTRRRY